MSYFSVEGIKISAIAGAVPTKIVHSSDYENIFGEEAVQKFIDSTGIKEHRETHELQTASDLGCAAAENLLAKTGINKEDIGLLIFGSQAPDYRRPATAYVLQKRLGLNKDCAAFDVSLGCSAFCYCLGIAASMLQHSDSRRALLILAETSSKITSKNDRSVAMMFGDAGAAILLEKTENNDSMQEDNRLNILLRADGSRYKSIIIPAGGYRNMHAAEEPMLWDDGNMRTLYNLNMNGVDVFSFAISDVTRSIKEFMQNTETDIADYDCLALHQANHSILKYIAKSLHMPLGKIPVSLDKYGNTSGASIPLTLCDCYGEFNDDKKQNILMSGFGTGLSWGVLAAKINPKNIYPIIETDDYYAEGIINSPEDWERIK